VPYIKGVQEKGVITTVKHFACNNSDYDRHRMNSEVDERTLHEIYLPAFRAAVEEADTKSVMCAYNPINGTYASENSYLLTDVLRDQWKFRGFVISDWVCVYSTEGPVKAGLDLEMPFAKYMNAKKIKPLLNKGALSEEDIDKKIRNMMRAFFEIGAYSRPMKDNSFDEYSKTHSQISLDTAREAIVLLKNEKNLLPLDRSTVKQIAVLGELASDTPTCGGGSCNVISYDKVNILDGIKELAGDSIEVTFIEGRKGKLKAHEKQRISDADAVIVCAGFTYIEEGECYDRSWKLINDHDRLIKNAAQINPNTAVVLVSGSGVETESWINDAPAILHSFFLGERGGTAIAEVIFGDTNPSGKLPFTMAKRWEDFKSTKYYVKKPEKISLARIVGPQGVRGIRKVWSVKYEEKLMVGYRHFDTNNIGPQFPFGFGLSYTDFETDDLKLSSNKIKTGEDLQVSIKVKNTGKFKGSEDVQFSSRRRHTRFLYVSWARRCV